MLYWTLSFALLLNKMRRNRLDVSLRTSGYLFDVSVTSFCAVSARARSRGLSITSLRAEHVDDNAVGITQRPLVYGRNVVGPSRAQSDCHRADRFTAANYVSDKSVAMSQRQNK